MQYSRAVRGNPSIPYLLLIPALVIGGTVLVYPLFNGLYLAFTNYSLLSPGHKWVGLTNFINDFKNPVYWEIYANSIIIIFCSVFFQLLIGLSLALALNRRIPLQGAFRSLVLVIWIVPDIVVALLWMIVFNADFGILNFVLKKIGIIGNFVTWLGRPIPAKIALIMVYSWRGTPFFMVMLLAALQTVPRSVLDAATIDGANAIQRFRIIVVPFIRDIIILSCLLSTVRLFQDITQIFILTNGGPINSTTTLAIHVYKQAFNAFDIGNAASIGVTWLLLLLVFAFFYIKLVTRGEFQR